MEWAGRCGISGGFGVVTKENGKPVADETTVRALGLKMPGPSH
jgi:hypothetical protein